MNAFVRVDPPRCHAARTLNAFGTWHTWSALARRRIADAVPALLEAGPPSLIHLRQGRAYDYTFSLLGKQAQRLGPVLGSITEALCTMRVSTRIVLLTELLDDGVDGVALHHLFAWLRDDIARRRRHPFGALYAPLGTIGPTAGDFPLHADLYPPELLFNVFDDVPDDGSGTSLFMPMPCFVRTLPQIERLPVTCRERLEELLRSRVVKDSYDEFFNLLYGTEHPWHGEARTMLASAAFGLRFRRGEGYLIHDRRWLHGRRAPRGGVGANRVHRLVFEGDATRRPQTARTKAPQEAP